MGIVSIQHFSDNTMLGLWHIAETTESLIRLLDLDLDELLEVYNKKTRKRKNEWLASRVLLQEMLGKSAHIKYDMHGKPFLNGMDTHISISHSGAYACVYLDRKVPVGVDIQQIKPSILAGADFFLNESELSWIGGITNTDLHLIWSAKESVFKCMGIPDLDLKKDIKLNPFQSNQNDLIEVTICSQSVTRDIQVRFSLMGTYVLTWTV